MEWHGFSERFPLLEGPEWEVFKASIKKAKGNNEPVKYRVFNGKKQGLDGRNRFKACEELKLPCKMEAVEVGDQEVKEYVLACNVHRRHLSIEFRRELVAELRDDGKSTRAIAEALGVSPGTVRNDLSAGGQSCPPDKEITGKDGKTYKSRAERVGQKAPKSFRVREPGDDTDQIAADRKAERARPKPGSPKATVAMFEKAIGEGFKVLVQIGKDHGLSEANSIELRAMFKALNQAIREARDWVKEMK